MPDDRGRVDKPSPDCPVEVALAVISGKWATLVLRELLQEPMSFSQLRTVLPELSAKVLSERLRALQEAGVVSSTRSSGFPARTRYELTQAGRELRPLLIELYRAGACIIDKRDVSVGSPF